MNKPTVHMFDVFNVKILPILKMQLHCAIVALVVGVVCWLGGAGRVKMERVKLMALVSTLNPNELRDLQLCLLEKTQVR